MVCFSLRGTISFPDNGLGKAVRVFDYVSPDRTRAWRVARAYFWPVGIREDTGSDADGKMLTQATLFTDAIQSAHWNDLSDPTENRAFAWAFWAGYARENGASDFITPECPPNGIAEFIIDPDTLVVKELWIIAGNTKEGTINPIREWGYMIVLEEDKISPSQSVFQQLKGMGQNIGT